MGFFSGGSNESRSYSGLRGTGHFDTVAGGLSDGYTFGMGKIKSRVNEDNPLGLGADGFTDAQRTAFGTLGKNLFGNVSSNYAARGFLNPDNISGVIGSSLTQAAPQLMGQIFQNQMGNQSVMSDRFGALTNLINSGTGALGTESYSKTKGPNLLGQAVSGWANPAQLGSFMQGASSLMKSSSGGM